MKKKTYVRLVDLISNEGKQTSDCSSLLTGKNEFSPDKEQQNN